MNSVNLKQNLARLFSLSLAIGGLGGFVYTPASHAVDRNTPISWQFLSGDYASQYDNAGMPQNLEVEPMRTFSDGFWARLSAALPERQDIRQSNPDFITDDAGANIALRETGEVFVSFLHEGAGYRNSLGYFTFDPANPPQSLADIQEKIIFPNVSFTNSGGNARGLKSGHTLKLGSFAQGTHIGFVLASDGFDAKTGVKSNMDRQIIFTTLKALNSEIDASLKAHTVLLYDAESQHVVLGLEDTLRTSPSCDHDFNDVLFTVSSNPPTAINPDALEALDTNPDSDKDGVPDAQDPFPNDAERAFEQRYPEDGSYYTLAFEDNWPAQGDYDMNDLVVQYRYEQITDAQGNIKDLTGYYQVKARGAELHNAFALEIPGTRPQDLASATLTQQGNTKTLSPEAQQEHLVFQVIKDATQWTPSNGCKFFNTEKGCAQSTPSDLRLNLTFKTPLSPSVIGFAPYNPFIYRTDRRGLEVHLPNHAPTSKASKDLFGSQDDASNTVSGNTYKTKANLPWALNIPSAWDHPIEHQPISKTYLRFKNWAESSGSSNTDWFLSDKYTPFLFGGNS
jgi:LruC domain-containing protein